jgi:hypothetical protein
MRRIEIPGGLEAEALPSGAYACRLTRGVIETHLGHLDQSAGTARWLRITEVGGFQIAAQCEERPVTLHWRGTWEVLPTTPVGVSPVLFDDDGALHISDGSIGSQGWRYVDPLTGRLVTGDETYRHPRAPALYEYTDIGDGLYVGQHGDDTRPGCVLWDGARLRMVEAGRVRFIRANRNGETVALAMMREDGLPAVVLWTTVEELLALPPLDAATPDEVARIGRPLWMGFIEFGVPAPAVPANGRFDIWANRQQPNVVKTLDGRDICSYAAAEHDSDVDELDQVIAARKREYPGLPCLAYWTLQAQGVRAPRGGDLIGVECYRKTVESETGFEHRVRAAARRAEAVWLIAQCYTSNRTNTDDLPSIARACARVARDEPRVRGLLIFSAGPERPTGWEDHPEAHDVWRRVFAGIAGAPPLYPPVLDPPARPADPPPDAPAQPDPFFPRARALGDSMDTIRCHLRRAGRYVGIDPSHPETAYADREAAAGWELAEIAKLAEGRFFVRMVEAGRYLCLTPDGTLASREAVGGWETFAGAEQPDGLQLLYRTEHGQLVPGDPLVVEAL